ncbi:alpha-L-fucosidase [Pedobacter psychroterrae]|uniref:alpha-L-fucosidase n=1 Tax=Pedobacter psychroterrae TaxID=2530453 RepID=A0A4R0NJ03_9SPHI|nr:alpha-L-fucosidase [Pedobacter psychroterrae]TCC99787.1 alpha-L-fucosidase [Pedobacter psychroterrae]
MKRRALLKGLATVIPAFAISSKLSASTWLLDPDGAAEFARPPFSPTWESLKSYQVPDWYKDAKFGIWAHWGPQCQPERGDWYARGMYEEGSDQYKYHVEKYGHPSKFGFKDVINEWKAEKWDPEYLVGLYKNAGAQYFVALANHHDNLDLYNSKHQAWNSVNMGPKKDIVGGWAKAAKKHKIQFGVSVHAAHAWSWYETAQRADKSGPMAGVPYDGKLTKADGQGKWWDGQDPQELYAQNHPLSERSENNGTIHSQWNWGGGVAKPTEEHIEKFYQRTIDLIDQYDPQLVYFDDTALPFWPISDAGLRIAAHLYNKSVKKHGKLKAVINGKILDKEQRQCMVWDIERGQSNEIEPYTWQTDTCIGSWHYDRRIYDNHHYKSAKTVIHTLADVVSKNGNLLLNVPLRGDGTMDSDELKVVTEIGEWMKVNKEAIIGTRPWKKFGEGPAIENAAPLSAQGFNEGKGKPFGAQDIRFTTKGKLLYAIPMGWPEDGELVIKSLGSDNPALARVNSITMLGHGAIKDFTRDAEGLKIKLPVGKPALSYAYVLKIS